MSNLTDFFPSGGGGGLTPKFEEFNASGTFTPSQALIDAGGYIEVFLVGGGGMSSSNAAGCSGGEVLIKKMYITSVSSCSVTIGSGATAAGAGGNSSFLGSTAGGSNITSLGGAASVSQNGIASNSWGGGDIYGYMNYSAGNGVFGYGAGSGSINYGGGVRIGKPNSGQGGAGGVSGGGGGSGYCLIKWYE